MNKNAALAAVILLCSVPVFAQPTAGPAPPKSASDVTARFKAADKDSDGTLDKTEAATLPGLAGAFEAIDTDRDGTLDLKEVEAYQVQTRSTGSDRLERRFKATDTDRDGTIDRKEAAAWPGLAKHFDTVDTDKDGTVDLNEVKTAMRRRPPRTPANTATAPSPDATK
jgi:Ca2+-binding EF-hand superfamily protein